MVFLSFLSNRSVFIYPPTDVQEILRALGKSSKSQKSSHEKVNKVSDLTVSRNEGLYLPENLQEVLFVRVLGPDKK